MITSKIFRRVLVRFGSFAYSRCLPNWKNLKNEAVTDEESQISEEDMRALNSKESSILTSNLSSDDQLIPQQEILTDTAQLKTLGNLCESLVC